MPGVRPRRLSSAALAIAGTLAWAHGAASAPPAGLTSTLVSWTRGHPLTSALVWRLDPGGAVPIVSYRPSVGRPPASTMKLVTSAGALLTLGPSFRFRTVVSTDRGATTRGGILTGPIYLKGYGDPVLATTRYARAFLGPAHTSLSGLAGQLRARGIRIVRGPIVADETFLDSRRTGPGWEASYTTECGPLSALTLNEGYTDDRGVHRARLPAVFAGLRLRGMLARRGVRQVGGVSTGATPAARRPLATVLSPTLATILRTMNHQSDNHIAETLAKDVGAYGWGSPSAYGAGYGSTAAGTSYTARLLALRGILSGRDRLVDGSGLSHSNRLTATTLVRLLARADAEPAWGVPLIRSLPTGGTGTLVHRLLAPDVRSRVHAKTGYITWATALAGIVRSPSGRTFAFAFLMNTADITQAHATQDALVTLLARGAGDAAPALGPAWPPLPTPAY